MDQQQLRLTADAAGRDAALHRALFDVMLAARERTGIVEAAGPVLALLRGLATEAPPAPPARFEAMRALFVLGVSLPSDTAERAEALRMLADLGLGAAPPTEADPLKLSLRNNHLLLQAAMLLAWPEVAEAREVAGALTARFLSGMDEAGRFPVEMCRGASALWYSNLAVMLLTAVAHADRDSAAPMVADGTLARAIAGLAAALEDPAPVRAHARRNLYAHPDHGRDPNRLDTGFLAGYRRSRHYMAWTVLARDLLGAEAVPLGIPPDDRFPVCSDFIGGFAETRLRRRG